MTALQKSDITITGKNGKPLAFESHYKSEKNDMLEQVAYSNKVHKDRGELILVAEGLTLFLVREFTDEHKKEFVASHKGYNIKKLPKYYWAINIIDLFDWRTDESQAMMAMLTHSTMTSEFCCFTRYKLRNAKKVLDYKLEENQFGIWLEINVDDGGCMSKKLQIEDKYGFTPKSKTDYTPISFCDKQDVRDFFYA